MAADSTWRDMFSNWPAAIPQRGIVVNAQGETIPFKGFMTRDETLLLERTNPDPLGSRFILLRIDTIAVLKLIDPLKPEVFMELGFQGELSGT